MQVRWQELIDSETRGRWWRRGAQYAGGVGGSSGNSGSAASAAQTSSSSFAVAKLPAVGAAPAFAAAAAEVAAEQAALLRLAEAQRMNTDTRRCVQQNCRQAARMQEWHHEMLVVAALGGFPRCYASPLGPR